MKSGEVAGTSETDNDQEAEKKTEGKEKKSGPGRRNIERRHTTDSASEPAFFLAGDEVPFSSGRLDIFLRE